MNAPLIAAAEAALAELKWGHGIYWHDCLGPEHCPTIATITNLEAELAKAKSIAPAMDPRDVADAILRAK